MYHYTLIEELILTQPSPSIIYQGFIKEQYIETIRSLISSNNNFPNFYLTIRVILIDLNLLHILDIYPMKQPVQS